MALCMPLALTQWSDSVLVKGCVPGARIRIPCLGAARRAGSLRLAELAHG